MDGKVQYIYILVRPGVASFIKRMHKHYELVVFTASLSIYAEPLCAQLDPEGTFTYKLFREHCTFHEGSYVKDLTRLGRAMTDVLIVDNSPIAYMFQPENAIPCTSWYSDMADTELDRIATLLEKMAYEEDVRKIVDKVTNMKKIYNEEGKYVQTINALDDRGEQLYLQSHKRDHSQKQVDASRRYGHGGENQLINMNNGNL
jgi:Dullard-like phosphatase family protein